MIKVGKFQYLPIFVICCSIFINVIVSVAAGLVVFFLYLFLLKAKDRFNKADFLLYAYFFYGTMLYYALGLEPRQYVVTIFFPVLMYTTISLGSSKMNDIKMLKFTLFMLIIYSILIFFRDVNGNFSLSLSNNFFMQERQIDDSLKEDRSIFFMNPTLMTVWLISAFIFAQALYTRTKKKLYLALLVGMTILIFLSNTRAAMGCLVLIVIINNIAIRRNIRTLVFLPLVLLPIVFIVIGSLGNAFQFQSERLAQLVSDNSDYGLGSRYDIYWPTAIFYIFKNFWGNGHFLLVEKTGKSAHNEFLGQALGVGVVMAIIYYCFIFYHLIRNYRVIKHTAVDKNTWNEIAFYLLITYLINGMTEQISTGNFSFVALMLITIGWSKRLGWNTAKRKAQPFQTIEKITFSDKVMPQSG